MTGELPYDGLPDPQISLKVCDINSPDGPVEDWKKYPQLQGLVKELLMDCWSQLPSARPSMSAIIQRLNTLLDSCELESRTLPRDRATVRGFILVPTLTLAIIFIGSALCKCIAPATNLDMVLAFRATAFKFRYVSPLYYKAHLAATSTFIF